MVLNVRQRRPDRSIVVPTKIGNPGMTTFPSVPYYRNCWLLYPHSDGRMTIGMGSSQANSGAPPIWSLDTNEAFHSDDGVDFADHQVDHIVNLGGTDYLLGHDRVSTLIGNFYTYQGGGQWTKSSPNGLSGAIHIFGAALLGDTWWFSVGANSNGPIMRSSDDDGATWTTYNVPASGALIRPLRAWTTFVLGSTLYASTSAPIFSDIPSGFTTTTPFISTFYWTGSQWDVTSFNFAPNDPLELEFEGETIVSGRIDKAVPFTVDSIDYLVYNTARTRFDYDREPLSLYKITDGGSPIPITDLEGAPWDIFVDGSTLYVITNRLADGNVYKTIVYSTTNLVSWTKEMTFYPSERHALTRRGAIFNGLFYFGLGCTKTFQSDASGDILRVAM